MTPQILRVLDPIDHTVPPNTASTAIWVGRVDRTNHFADSIKLNGHTVHSRARILVTDDTHTCGFIDIDIDAAAVSGRELRAAVDALPTPIRPIPSTTHPRALPPVSIIVCTRDRTEKLARALTYICAVDYPDFEVIVVDNAATNLDTWHLVEALADPRVTVIHEFVPGLAAARNRGARTARHALLAFTDDDVIVDAGWLRAIVEPFEDPAVSCVTGMVPSAQLATSAQLVFDRRVHWASSEQYSRFTTQSPPTDRLFPFRVSQFGTGANFAVRAQTLFALGGFDEALGAGAPTQGGEDIDWFVRTLIAGYTLVYTPDAVVWHTHRADTTDMKRQAHGYGTGLSAWMTKVLLDPQLRRAAARRAPAALIHLRRSLAARGSTNVDNGSGAARAEVAGLLAGPKSYLVARSQGRHPHPLRTYNRATRRDPS